MAEPAAALLIDKPAGISSAQVVARVRRVLNLDRVGHAGTLDPFATGLLVCLTGRATRIADLVQAGAKTYSGTIRLGVVTDSDDCTGAVIQKSEIRPDISAVHKAAESFLGLIQQLPPRISAIKIDGERAYKRARAGEEFEIKAREVEVTEFSVSSTESSDLIAYRIQCSKGTYIRSLARDLGNALGCGACVETLRREASGRLHVSNATSLEKLNLNDLIPWQLMLPELRQVFLDEYAVSRLWAGSTLELGKVLQTLGKIQTDERIVYGSSRTKQAHGLLRLVPPSGIVLEANIVEPQVLSL